MLISLVLGLYFTKKASSSTEEFFLSGRKLPWWLAGTSMVATTFSSDTPLYITALVRTKGIYENWQWWCFLMTGMLSVIVFAQFWKRAGVMTDVELTEMRYSGRAASTLRGWKALYFSLLLHTIIKAQVILAMAKILDATLGWGKWTAILISSSVTIVYSLLSGYWGVIVTDFFQFVLAQTGAIIVAVYAVNRVGGLSQLKPKIDAMYGNNHFMDFTPPIDGGFLSLPILTFIAYMGMSWWSKYSSDGGGVVVQRMASCKSEKDAIGATFFFNVANYALRSWPWIIAALASLILYPAIKDHESVYPIMALNILPSGLKGIVFASFFAAFMSTVGVYLNLSSAYFMKDFYMRFVKQNATEKHYIFVTRLSMLALSGVTAVVTYYATTIEGTFKFLIAFGSGTGLVFIMRWYWWRVNAWSEISAMAASTISASAIYIFYGDIPFYQKLFFIIFSSTVVWVVVTLLTKPTDESTLIEFYKRVPVGGFGWKPVEEKLTRAGIKLNKVKTSVFDWLLGTLFVYGLTLSTGMLLLGRYTEGLICLITGIICFTMLKKRIFAA
ncbi:MAG: Na+:solute symporter [Nitrospirae bacterium]|nr:Na+:solute symporter [Nitrospirota bacterium]